MRVRALVQALIWALTLGVEGAAAGPRLAPARVSPFAASRYVAELPVMAGLWESGSGYLYRLGPDARLAETRMVGRAAPPQVQSFYDGALASTGWRRTGAPWAFRRGRERMILHVSPHGAAGSMQTEALFVVTPDAAGALALERHPAPRTPKR